MAIGPDDASTAKADRLDEAPHARSVGEHAFLWLAWALAAAFWGAALTTFVGILRAAGQAVATPAAPGAPGGMGYLAFVIAAFAVVALALAYASLRSRSSGPLEARSRRATAQLYDASERQDDAATRGRGPDSTRRDADFR
jgi:hypothetical protein